MTTIATTRRHVKPWVVLNLSLPEVSWVNQMAGEAGVQ